MSKKLKCIWIAVSVVLLLVLIIDCFFVKKLSLVSAISEMWEAFLPSIVLFFFAIWVPEQGKKK